MLAVAAVMGVVVAGLAIPFAGVVGIGRRNVAKTMDSLPAELKTEPLAQRTAIVDANGNVIASLYDENRINVPLSQISRTMVKAIVAIEDYRFYQHGALDLKGTLRALVTNQASGGVVQGGSSITQQMVKLTLLSQAKTKAEQKAATDDTYARKIKELRYADRVRAEPLQGLDPRALPQHRLLRRRRLRHPGGGPALLRQERQGPQPAPVGDAGRPGQEPHRLRPDQLPRPGARAAQRRARPDGRSSTSSPPRQAEQTKSTDLGLHVQPRQERLRVLPAPRSSATTSSTT